MRKLYLAIALSLAAPLIAGAQFHPYAFGTPDEFLPNWYANYVGTRLDIESPVSVAGEKVHTVSNTGASVSTDWGALISTPLVHINIVMPQAGDSLADAPITVSMSGKVALVYRGNNEFACKAQAAAAAGAIACIIVNNIDGPPASMSAGVTCTGVTTIPVLMISKADGDALDVQYCSGVIPTVTITPWGRGNAHDAGFVPEGTAGWSNYAIPSNQLFPATHPLAYKQLDGAFVANYGTSAATHVKVNSTLSFTPTGSSSSSVLHTGVTDTVITFSPVDSIYALFDASEYNVGLSAAGTGRFDLKYHVVSDVLDLFTGDDTMTRSFYATDSVYSKGKYDFANNMPSATNYVAPGGGGDYMWGPMYFVAHGGTSLSSVQFSLQAGTPGPLASSISEIRVHAFKWVDGSYSPSELDSFIENGELSHVSMGIYTFSPTDTSGGVFKVTMGDPSTGAPGGVLLDSASWYYIAVEVPGGYFLGVDGQNSSLPRVYGRAYVSGIADYPGVLWPGNYDAGIGVSMTLNPDYGNALCPFPVTSNRVEVDSFNYDQQKGNIPAVAMIVNNNPLTDITGTTGICIGSSFTFHDPIPGGTWTSSTPSVATVDLTSGLVSGIAAGTAVITYHISSSIATITVSVAPVPAPGSISGPSTVCAGSVITLIDTFSGGTGTWSADTGSALSVSASGVVTGITSGTFASVYYIVSNACMTLFVGHFISVGPALVTGTVSGPSAVCVGATATLSDAATGGTWSTTGGHTSVAAGVVTGVSAGADVVSYTVTTSCGSGAATAAITVNPLPTPTILVSGVTLSTTSPYVTYQWLLPASGGALSGETNATYTAALNGAYAVTVTDANGCTGTSGLGIVSTVGVKNVNAAGNSIFVSPNPTSGAFSIRSGNAGVFTLYSLEGREITRYSVSAGLTLLNLPSALATGAYMGKFEGSDGSIATIRLVYEP